MFSSSDDTEISYYNDKKNNSLATSEYTVIGLTVVLFIFAIAVAITMIFIFGSKELSEEDQNPENPTNPENQIQIQDPIAFNNLAQNINEIQYYKLNFLSKFQSLDLVNPSSQMFVIPNDIETNSVINLDLNIIPGTFFYVNLYEVIPSNQITIKSKLYNGMVIYYRYLNGSATPFQLDLQGGKSYKFLVMQDGDIMVIFHFVLESVNPYLQK